MKNILILLFSLSQITILFAGNENQSIGGRSSAMGNASVCFSDVWSIHNNQAGLAGLKNMSVGFYYENRYSLRELSLKSAAFILPTNSGVFGLSMNYFGYENYNEKKIGLAYGKSFGERFSAGLQLDYLSTHIGEQYGNKSTVTFELGIIAGLTENLILGAHIYNPLRVKLSDYNDERIPSILKLGLSYSFSEKLLISIETEKDMNFAPVFKGGIEYKIIKEVYVRTGISTNPVLNTFGFGVEMKSLKIDFASSLHPVLGYSPQISMIYNIK